MMRIASNVSRAVPFSTRSADVPYMLSKMVAARASFTWKSPILFRTRASFFPRSELGRSVPTLMARRAEGSGSRESARFNQPSVVAFRPGVPDSM